jgi:hypothetical protein
MNTRTVYFAARNGKVMSWDGDVDRRAAVAYVNRNNASAYRRGDDTNPYHVLAYRIPVEAGAPNA